MANIAELAARITTEGAELAAAQIRKFQAAVVESGDRIDAAGQRMSDVGGRIQRNVGLPLAAVGGASIKMALDFDESFTKIGGLVGVPTGQLETMREAVLGLAGETAQAPVDLAEALFTVTSAGFRGSEALAVLEQAAKGSSVGMGETRTIAEALTATISAYGPETISAADAMDQFVATVRAGNFEAPQFAGALGQVLPIAAELDIAFSDIGGSVALMTRQNNDASQSITQTKAIMEALIKPTVEATTLLAEQGLTMADVRAAASGPGGLVAALRMLEEASGGNQETFARILSSSEALKGGLSILGADAETLASTFGAVADSSGVLGEAFTITAESDAFKAKQAFADLQAAGIALGQDLLPVGIQIIDMVQGMIDAFQGLPPGVQELAAYGVVAGIALGPTLRLAGGVTSLTGQMIQAKAAGQGLSGAISGLNPVTIGLTATVGLALYAYQDWAKAKAEAKAAAERMAEALTDETGAWEQQTAAEARAKLEADGTIDTLNRLGLNIEDISGQVDGNAAQWDRLKDMLLLTGGPLANVRGIVEESTGPLSEWADTILTMAENGEIGRTEARQLVMSIESVSDAFEESVGDVEELNFKLLDNAAANYAVTESEREAYRARILAAESTTEQREINEDLQRELRGVSETTADTKFQNEALAQSQEGVTLAIEGTIASREELNRLEQEHIDQIVESMDANIAYENQQARTTETLTRAQEVIDDSTSSQADHEQAQRDAIVATRDLADAAVAHAEAQAEARGEVLSTDEKLRIQIATFEDMAGTLAPGSALRQGVLGYSSELEDIAREILTEARLEGDAESIAAWELLLDRITADRLVNVGVNYSGGGLVNVPGSVQADGGILTMANGGVLIGDRTRPQIGKAGQPVLFAEAGDGDESYIPHALARRPRATAILAETADTFGYDLSRKGYRGPISEADSTGGPQPRQQNNNFNLTTIDNGATDIKREFRRMERRAMTAAFR